LFLGTLADNTHDAMRKGRIPHGTGHWSAKLTDEIIRAVRTATGTHQAIADRFGLTRIYVTRIRNRDIWRHVA